MSIHHAVVSRDPVMEMRLRSSVGLWQTVGTKRKEVVQLARHTIWDLGGGWPLAGSWTVCEFATSPPSIELFKTVPLDSFSLIDLQQSCPM